MKVAQQDFDESQNINIGRTAVIPTMVDTRKGDRELRYARAIILQDTRPCELRYNLVNLFRPRNRISLKSPVCPLVDREEVRHFVA